MKIKSSWKVTDEQIYKTKVEFAWNATLGEVRQLGILIDKLVDYSDNSIERKILSEFGMRLKGIYQSSETKLKDTTVEIEMDPNPNSIKL